SPPRVTRRCLTSSDCAVRPIARMAQVLQPRDFGAVAEALGAGPFEVRFARDAGGPKAVLKQPIYKCAPRLGGSHGTRLGIKAQAAACSHATTAACVAAAATVRAGVRPGNGRGAGQQSLSRGSDTAEARCAGR